MSKYEQWSVLEFLEDDKLCICKINIASMQARKLKIESCYCEPFILAWFPLPGQMIFLIHSQMTLRISTVADLKNKFGFPEQAIGFTLKRNRTMDRGSILPVHATEQFLVASKHLCFGLIEHSCLRSAS